MGFEGSGLMQLHSDSHRRKEPTVVPMTTPPTPFQCDDVFDHPWPRLHGLSTLAAPCAVHRSVEDFYHLLAFHSRVTITTRGGQQGHPALALKLGNQRLIRRVPLPQARVHDAAPLPRFPPQALGFLRPLPPGLQGPQDAGSMRHPPARALPVSPPSTGALAPCGLLSQATPPVWYAPWLPMRGVPDRPPGFLQHRIAADHGPRNTREGSLATHLPEGCQAGSRCFFSARQGLSALGGTLSCRPPRAFQHRQVIR